MAGRFNSEKGDVQNERAFGALLIALMALLAPLASSVFAEELMEKTEEKKVEATASMQGMINMPMMQGTMGQQGMMGGQGMMNMMQGMTSGPGMMAGFGKPDLIALAEKLDLSEEQIA